MENFFGKSVLSLILIFSFISCDNLANRNTQTQDLIDVQTLENSVEKVSVQPVDPGNLDGLYNVSITFNKSVRNQKMPDGLLIRGVTDAQLTYQDYESNILYTGNTNSEKIKKLYINSISKNGKNSPDRLQELSIGCDVSFTTPGEYDENCEDSCPDASLLGGDTWFCVCVYNCHVEVDIF